MPTTEARIRLLACAAPAVAGYALPPPAGLPDDGWRLLGIFAAVIVGFVLRPLAMGPLVLLGVVVAAVSGVLPFERGLAGYGREVVWLVVGAFLLAGAVAGTGLGRRVALLLVRALGRSTVGLAYAQCAAELLLGPVVPSNTARGGGILAPVSASLARALGSRPDDGPRRAGTYLALVGAHANLVTAAMFLTGMAANVLLRDAARLVYGVEFGWTTWLVGAIVPGLVSLALLPLVLLWLAPPAVRDGRPARAHAAGELRRMGAPSRAERVMAGVFVLLLALWTTKPLHGLDTALVAWIGVAVLVVSGAHPWGDVVGDARAWDVLIWLGGLLALADGLRETGVVDWFAEAAAARAAGLPVLPTVLALALVYFYSMVGFSMLTAHISALAVAFLGLCAAAGAPALLAVPLFAYLGNLCGCTTNYSSGPIIVYFGLGYVPASAWFRIGFAVSVVHLAVWVPLGLLWWKALGWW